MSSSSASCAHSHSDDLPRYSLGTVSIPLETAGFFIFFFVFPLAFSLTGFLMWISESLFSF